MMLTKAIPALAVLACIAHAETADSQVRSEVQRLRESLQAQPITDPRYKDSNSMIADLLKATDDAIAAGSLYLGLEKLVQVSDFVEGVRNSIQKNDAVKDHLAAFEDEWKKTSADLESRGNRGPKVWNRKSAAIQAMAELAQARTGPLLEGGRGFAVSTKPEDGLLYLGEARAQADFAAFCALLQSRRSGHPAKLRSLLPELIELQKKANEAFQPPRSIDLHTRFIALNSTIKVARELDASKAYAGALYQYLEAVRHYGMLFMPPVDPPKQPQWKAALATARQKLGTSKHDDSILEIFLQRAASQVAHADGSAPSADEWRSAQVTVEQVLPAYTAALRAPAALQRTYGKTIDLTVVRWPYT